ncbi:histone deacetylase [Aquimarina sp. ERC-38]|uniref:histone deacetylase family protein n=1 Tax=Aquimarina sp. ERC-38 TaxID=2949996 RepID=UPI002246ED36|nr:histone deacetylase [Aquimarina sp. ERC-38]UZO81930.1 histone deacetylase [Aquimarina sp. ERC-38]
MLKIAYHPIYQHPLPEGHRFPMEKYDLLPKQLLHEGSCTSENFFEPAAALSKDITRVHTKDYFDQLSNLNIDRKAARKIGFPLSEALVEREILIAGGTIQATQYAFKHGIAMNIAGGTHHAYADHGEAFCMLNDQAIGAAHLLAHQLVQKILIIDLDVHQGNGTAKIFEDHSDVFTFSMHGASNYPFKKEKSDLDIPLPKGTTDKEYLQILHKTLPKLIDKVQPDFIFYLSGVDILDTDKLGTLSCTIEGCKQRDQYILESCYKNNIPVVCSMGGGYSPDIQTIIEAHANTYRTAQYLYF